MPAYTFGLRVTDPEKINSPGPNTYGLPSTLAGKDKTVSARSFVVGERNDESKTNEFFVIKVERAPAHTMHSKFDIKDHILAPGPNAYGLQNFKPGTRAPAYTLGAKIPPLHQTTEC